MRSFSSVASWRWKALLNLSITSLVVLGCISKSPQLHLRGSACGAFRACRVSGIGLPFLKRNLLCALLVGLKNGLGLRVRRIEDLYVQFLQRDVVGSGDGGHGAEHPRDISIKIQFHREDQVLMTFEVGFAP